MWHGYISIEFVTIEDSPTVLYNDLGERVDSGAELPNERKHQAVSADHKRAIIEADWESEFDAAALRQIAASSYGVAPDLLSISAPGDSDFGTIYLLYAGDDLMLTALVHDGEDSHAQAFAYTQAFPLAA